MRYTNTQWMHDRITKGVVTGSVGAEKRTPDALADSRWNKLFEYLMRNRLGIGYFRYGIKQERTGVCYRNVSGAISRLRRYIEDGNQEHLVDSANLLMLEFGIPCEHKHPHFSSTDDGEHITEIT